MNILLRSPRQALATLGLFFHTVKYLSLWQIWSRARRKVRRLWSRLTGSTWSDFSCNLIWPQGDSIYVGLADVTTNGPWADEVTETIRRGEAISSNIFCFLNHAHKFNRGELNWDEPTVSQLWRYHLHYFDYVIDLLVWSRTGGPNCAIETFKSLVSSWLSANRRITGDGWHPYPVSLRLVNWLNGALAFGGPLTMDQFFHTQMLPALTAHARILDRDLEWDVRGNHLLKNLRALLWAGIVFPGEEAKGLVDKALGFLKSELKEQIDGDGAHFERNPGYHLTVLKDCLEAGLLLKRTRNLSLDWLDSAVRRMLDYLLIILPTDLHVPLLKDTCWDGFPKPEQLLTLGALYLNEPRYKIGEEFGLIPLLCFGVQGWEKFQRWPRNDELRGSKALKCAGYFILRDDLRRDYLIIDGGKPCPDYLPAHAHADLLSYELTVEGQRTVIDSGVFEYTRGPWRDHFRSTRAHNTVEVEGENQSEIWGSFRVGRRARPRKVLWRETKHGICFQAEHDGYCRLRPGTVHRRTVWWKKDGCWFFIDELLGKGIVSASNHVHCHPSLDLTARTDDQWEIRGGKTRLWLTAFGQRGSVLLSGATEPRRQGWYSERFGELVPNSALTLLTCGEMPLCFGYVIAKDAPADIQVNKNARNHWDVLSTWGGTTFNLSTDVERFVEIV